MTPHVSLPCGTGAAGCWKLAHLCCQASEQGLAKLVPWNYEAFYCAKRLDHLSLLIYPSQYARPMHGMHSSHERLANDKARIVASVSSATWHHVGAIAQRDPTAPNMAQYGEMGGTMETLSQSFSLLDSR